MAKQTHQFTTPVGRLVGGSVYNPKTEDYDGKPLTVKSGQNAGQPRIEFSFGVAFPKTPGATHWAQEAWLTPMWNLAHAAFPNGEAQRPDFAWKITDGDSTAPKKGRNGAPGKRPVDLEGNPGHWVIWFSSGTAPRLYNANGTQQLVEPEAIKNGYYVQVCGNCADNSPSASPGLYFNHSMVALAGFGPVISSGPDVTTAGFGAAPLPAGASATPPAGFNPVPPTPGGVTPGPNSSYASPNAPAGVPLPSVHGARVMSSKATSAGLTYESFQVGAPNSQWTDALLVQEGYMLAPPAPAASVPMAPPVPLAPAGSVPPPPGVAPIAVVPNPAFLQVGAPAATLPPPPTAPAGPMISPTSPQVTAKAAGMSFAQLMAMPGWNEQLLRQEGYIL